jgi:hypothetical protein
MAQDVGLLLRGLGAAFSNTVPQFRQEMAQEQEAKYVAQQRQQAMQAQNAEMLQARQKAMYQDADSALKLLVAGDLDGIVALGQDRLQLLSNFPDADPSDTARLTQFAMKARAGDPAASNALKIELLQTVSRGMQMGLIEPLKQPEIIPASSMVNGQVITRDAEGNIVSERPKGFQPEVTAPIPRTEQAKLRADLNAGLISQEVYKAEVERLRAGTPQNVWQEAGDLRREFSAIPSIRQFADQSDAFGRIAASAQNPSAAGDLALIASYMKLLDPGSTVREGEAASAQNAAGVPERIRALWNNLSKGERLTASQRSDFLNRAKLIYESAEGSYNRTYDQYKNIATRRNLPLEDALIDYRYQSNAQFPSFFNSQAEAEAANLPFGSVFEIPNPDNPDEILQVRVK